MEIERKFLVKELPDLSGAKSSEIMQGYVSISPEVRVRKLDDKYYRTEKGEGTVVREEREWEISSKEGEALFASVQTNVIVKTRYYIPCGKYTAELDIYKGKFSGLCVVEIEFPTLDEATAFVPPVWFGEDVSEKKEYRNKNLAQKDL